jgi:hypothetical protein
MALSEGCLTESQALAVQRVGFGVLAAFLTDGPEIPQRNSKPRMSAAQAVLP